MDLLIHRMGLVTLTDDALNVSNQLGTRQPAGNEAPSCHVKVDNRTSEPDNSLTAPSHLGGFGYVLQGNVDHRGNSRMVVPEEEKLDPTHVSDLESKIELDRYLHDLEKGLDPERG